MLVTIGGYHLLQWVVSDCRNLWAVDSLSVLDKGGGDRYDGKGGEAAMLRMRVVCQPTHRGASWSGDEGSTERRFDTCTALLDIHTLLKKRVSWKCSTNLLIVLDIIPGVWIQGA